MVGLRPWPLLWVSRSANAVAVATGVVKIQELEAAAPGPSHQDQQPRVQALDCVLVLVTNLLLWLKATRLFCNPLLHPVNAMHCDAAPENGNGETS